MSLRLLVDECLLNRLLLDALSLAGHDVLTVKQVNLLGKSDAVIFSFAIAENRIVITSNCFDFIELCEARIAANEHHAGVLLIYLYNNRSKDMTVAEIVKAIANLEETNISIADRYVSLVQYRY